MPDDINAIKPRGALFGHIAEAKIYSMAWHPTDPSVLVSVAQDAVLRVWNVESGKSPHAIHLRTAHVLTCALSPSGRLTASGGLDNIVTLHLLNDVAVPAGEVIGHNGFLACVTFHSDDTLLTAAGDATCALWSVHSRQRLHSFVGHTREVMCGEGPRSALVCECVV